MNFKEKLAIAPNFTSKFDNSTNVFNWTQHDCFHVWLARLFPNDTGMIVPKWQWHDFFQVRLTRLFPGDTGKIVFKWDWHNCSQVTLARLFRNETTRLFPSGFWLPNLYFVLQFVLWHNSSLVSVNQKQLCHVPGLWHMTPFGIVIYCYCQTSHNFLVFLLLNSKTICMIGRKD